MRQSLHRQNVEPRGTNNFTLGNFCLEKLVSKNLIFSVLIPNPVPELLVLMSW